MKTKSFLLCFLLVQLTGWTQTVTPGTGGSGGGGVPTSGGTATNLQVFTSLIITNLPDPSGVHGALKVSAANESGAPWGLQFTNDTQRASLALEPDYSVFTIQTGGGDYIEWDTGAAQINYHASAGHFFFGPVDMDDDLTVAGKVSATGGIDPPYLLLDAHTRGETKGRVLKEVPPAKQAGANLFFNSVTHKLELYLASEDAFYDLNGNQLNAGAVSAIAPPLPPPRVGSRSLKVRSLAPRPLTIQP